MKNISISLLIGLFAFAGVHDVSAKSALAEGQVSFKKTLFEIPVELPYAGVHYQYKHDAIYVNGNFVISGQCGGGIGAEDGPISSLGYERKPSEGGLWVFSENGNFVVEKDICNETGKVKRGIHHHSIGVTFLRGNDTGFIARTNFYELGPDNAIIYYTISGSNVMLQSRISANNQLAKGEIASIGDPALTDEALVDFDERQYDGGTYTYNDRTKKTAEKGVAVRALPSLSEISFFQMSNRFRPTVALGEYIIGAENRSIVDGESSKNNWIPYVVYRVSGETLEFVQELSEAQQDSFEVYDSSSGYVGRSAIDYVSKPNRIAFWNISLSAPNSDSVFIYELTSTGLRFVEKMKTPWDSNKSVSGQWDNQNAFAIAGDTVAFPTDDGNFEVWKNGEKIGSGQLPETKSYNEINNIEKAGYGNRSGNRTPHQMVITPSGKLLALNQYGAYLFEITADPGEEDDTEPTDPSDPTQPQQVDINAIMEQYGIEPLRDYNFQDTATNYSQSFSNTFFNSTNQTTDNVEQRTENYTLSRPPQTIAEIRAFQCAYNIVCEGSISTTGYGNLGPKTQAKINEVFGTGDVNGTQTTIQTSGMTIQEIQELINQLLQQVAELQAQLGSQS